MEWETFWIPIFKVLFAMFLGGVMGAEREYANKAAGLRTHMLVAGAAALLVVLGEVMIETHSGSHVAKVVQADPIRIIEAIITGISFLGAGTIIFRGKDESVEGLTTAASILFVAAIGISVALERYYFAAALTGIAIVILFGLGYIERFVRRLRKPK